MTSSKSIQQISQQVFALPSAKGQVVHTCKINCYGAVQLGSSFQVVHERVNLPHLKWNQVDQTRVCVWRFLLLQTQTLSCIQQRAELSAAGRKCRILNMLQFLFFMLILPNVAYSTFMASACLDNGEEIHFWGRRTCEVDSTTTHRMTKEWGQALGTDSLRLALIYNRPCHKSYA
jgi:hypothetical protein